MACIRRASAAALALAAAAALAQEPELQVTDAEGRMSRLGLVGKAQRIVHKGEPYLLVRVHSQDIRLVDLPGGRTDWKQASWLPLRVACDEAALVAGGSREAPLPLSLCREPVKVAAPFAVPVFLVFRYPKPGPAAVTLPVTVLPPEAAVSTRRDGPPQSAIPESAARLLGPHELKLQVLVTDPVPQKRR